MDLGAYSRGTSYIVETVITESPVILTDQDGYATGVSSILESGVVTSELFVVTVPILTAVETTSTLGLVEFVNSGSAGFTTIFATVTLMELLVPPKTTRTSTSTSTSAITSSTSAPTASATASNQAKPDGRAKPIDQAKSGGRNLLVLKTVLPITLILLLLAIM